MVRALMTRFAHLRRWVESEDVLQDVQLRLDRALVHVPFADGRHFLATAGMHIRYELLDLVKRYFGPHRLERQRPPVPNREAADDPPAAPDDNPVLLAELGELLELVAELPPEAREVFDLRVYQGLGWEDAAAVLGVSERTARRRFVEAKAWLAERLGDPSLITIGAP